MKKLLYIFIILSFLSCRNSKEVNISEEKIVVSDTASTKAISEIKTDTLTKISEPFTVNDIECYWKVSIIMEQGDYEGGYITRKLINNKTQKNILKDVDFYHINGYNEIDFEKEKRNFKDVNFDGLKDYITLNYSNSTPLNNFYNVHIFNSNIKSFDFSEELSDTGIEIDSFNRKVTSSYGYREHSSYKIHHFDKYGKNKFTEEFSEDSGWRNDTITVIYKFYKKIINGEVVKTKRDSIIEKWN